jgi:hypothetical protein
MSTAAYSIKVFGYYLLALGASLVSYPNMVLALFGVPGSGEVWIRVVGLLAFNIGLYYWFAAVGEATSVFRGSVYTRVLTFVAFIAFVALGLAPSALILFGTVDFAGALWTYMALKPVGAGATARA